MKGKDELQGTWSNFTPWLHICKHQGENCLGVVATPFGELGLNLLLICYRITFLTCKQSLECHITWYQVITPTPDLPTLKAHPTTGGGGRFEFCLLKWRERMNLKVSGAILPLGCAFLSTRVKTVLGGCCNPVWRTRVKSFVKLHREIEYCIAKRKGKLSLHFKKWAFVLYFFLNTWLFCKCK